MVLGQPGSRACLTTSPSLGLPSGICCTLAGQSQDSKVIIGGPGHSVLTPEA